ncbi:MAG TPA: glycosyltransferase family 39 protein [Ilumatobacteraceae bacterium]
MSTDFFAPVTGPVYTDGVDANGSGYPSGPPMYDPDGSAPGGDGLGPTSAEPPPEAPVRTWQQRVLKGREDDARWVRPSVLVLLVATGVLYIWGLGASGWANSFYSAAAQAGTKSWKAFFFGSSDASNFITVDKPPASLWVMEISARIFGVNAWSILVPQALEGVAAVGLLYMTVRRWFSAGAGLIAGAVMALTPIAVLMFRFNNPDAMLVLLLVAAAYALTRSLENGSTKWLLAAGGLVGFGFLAKMLQAFVVVPGFAIVYLIAAPPKFFKRLWQVALAGVAMFAAAGWWVAVVELVPASWRPYVGGSTNNSELNLIFGYNGLGRVTGNETGSVVGGGRGGGGGNSMWGPTGWTRMFNSDFGGQASWLIPAALILGIAGLAVTIRKARTDRSRAALLLWGTWLFVTGAVFSLSKGIIHPYYTVALAPGIGALIGIGAHVLWQHRAKVAARAVLAAATLVSVWWADVLLNRSPNWHPELRTLVVVAGVVAAVALLVGPQLLGPKRGKIVGGVAIAAALVAGLAGPGAFALETATTPHSGSIPSAGPAVTTTRGGLGGGRGFPGGAAPGGGNGGAGNGAVPGGGGFPGGGQRGNRGNGGFPGGGTFPGGGGFPGQNGTGQNGTGQNGTGQNGTGQNGTGQGGQNAPGIGGFGGGQGGIGGLLNGSTPSAALTTLLQADAGSYRWVLATIGANQASGYQLASGDPVMAIGGFNGTDPTPTLAAFQAYVAKGEIHYFVAGGTGGQSSDSSSITNWVTTNYNSVTVGGQTLYDLTSPKG